ncbi:MAG: ABC transporter permease [Lentisphaerota bacterium]
MNYYKKFRESVSSETFQIISIASGLIIMGIFFTCSSPYFFNVDNLLNVALQTSIIAIIAIGQTYVIITGGIDLSIGSIMALSGVISALCMNAGIDVGTSMVLGILAGCAIGALNGVLIVFGRLPPFIATLGTMSIARGIALLITNGIPISGLPDSFGFFGNDSVLGIPFPVILMIVLTMIFGYILKNTRLGIHTYACGSNLEAARLSGINTKLTIFIIYISSAFLASIAGLIFASRIVSGQPSAGAGYELYSVASSVIGGTNLMGGEGMVTGALLGALVIGVLRNGLNLLGISAFTQEVLIGVVIILAVYADRIKHRRN